MLQILAGQFLTGKQPVKCARSSMDDTFMSHLPCWAFQCSIDSMAPVMYSESITFPCVVCGDILASFMPT